MEKNKSQSPFEDYIRPDEKQLAALIEKRGWSQSPFEDYLRPDILVSVLCLLAIGFSLSPLSRITFVRTQEFKGELK